MPYGMKCLRRRNGECAFTELSFPFAEEDESREQGGQLVWRYVVFPDGGAGRASATGDHLLKGRDLPGDGESFRLKQGAAYR